MKTSIKTACCVALLAVAAGLPYGHLAAADNRLGHLDAERLGPFFTALTAELRAKKTGIKFGYHSAIGLTASTLYLKRIGVEGTAVSYRSSGAAASARLTIFARTGGASGRTSSSSRSVPATRA